MDLPALGTSPRKGERSLSAQMHTSKGCSMRGNIVFEDTTRKKEEDKTCKHSTVLAGQDNKKRRHVCGIPEVLLKRNKLFYCMVLRKRKDE